MNNLHLHANIRRCPNTYDCERVHIQRCMHNWTNLRCLYIFRWGKCFLRDIRWRHYTSNLVKKRWNRVHTSCLLYKCNRRHLRWSLVDSSTWKARKSRNSANIYWKNHDKGPFQRKSSCRCQDPCCRDTRKMLHCCTTYRNYEKNLVNIQTRN